MLVAVACFLPGRANDLSAHPLRSLQQFACFPLTATLFCFDAAEFLKPSTDEATVWTTEELWFDPKQRQLIFQHSKLRHWNFSLT
jgi:hypothetical protein